MYIVGLENTTTDIIQDINTDIIMQDTSVYYNNAVDKVYNITSDIMVHMDDVFANMLKNFYKYQNYYSHHNAQNNDHTHTHIDEYVNIDIRFNNKELTDYDYTYDIYWIMSPSKNQMHNKLASFLHEMSLSYVFLFALFLGVYICSSCNSRSNNRQIRNNNKKNNKINIIKLKK